MQVGKSRRTTNSPRNGVIAGSVWESRMKFDEVKGGVKVFNGDDNSVGGIEQKKKEISVSSGGSGGSGGNVGDQNGSPRLVYRRLKRNQSGGEVEKNKKTSKSEHVEGIERPPIQLRKTRSDGIEKNPNQIIRKTRSEGTRNSKDFGVIKDKMISMSNVGQIRNKKPVVDYDDDSVDGDEENEEEEEEIEALDEEKQIEIENKNFDVKEVNIEEHKQPKRVVNEENKNQISQDLVVLPISSIVSKKSTPVLDHPVIDQDLKNPPSTLSISEKSFSVKEVNIEEQKPKKVVIEENKFNQIYKTAIPISSRVRKQPLPDINHPAIDPNLTKLPPSSDEFDRLPESHSNLGNIVDLVMWRDVSKSALVFGFGTFVLLSSSFTKDINFSFISAISYMGLLYLAAIFLYKSIIGRGAIDFEESSENMVVGEEEAIWLLKMILPYLNEFLLKLRSLFSGDPATTMKLAVLLFILARCGSSITIWKVAKLGFFGVFTVPKVCSSYSTQLTAYGKFWVRRFLDAWESCSHKKAVALAGFTLVWNLSSIVARIWAVFMLIVVVRYYQQSILINEGWGAEMEGDGDDSYQRKDGTSTIVELIKGQKSW